LNSKLKIPDLESPKKGLGPEKCRKSRGKLALVVVEFLLCKVCVLKQQVQLFVCLEFSIAPRIKLETQ